MEKARMIRDTTNSWPSHPNLSKRFERGLFGARSERGLNAYTRNARRETKGLKERLGWRTDEFPKHFRRRVQARVLVTKTLVGARLLQVIG
jgi:hypothetical protein